MNKDDRISAYQLGILTFIFLFGSTAISNSAFAAGREAWLALILGSILGYLFIVLYIKIFELHEGKTLIQILQACFGKFIGNTLGLIYIFAFIHLAAMNVTSFSYYLVAAVYPETPLIVIMIMFMIAVIYALRSGLNTLGRLGEILVIVIPINVFLLSLSLILIHDFNVFKPFLENGLMPLIKGTLGILNFPFTDMVVFLMIYPKVTQRESIFKVTSWATLGIFLVFLIIILRDFFVLGAGLLKNVNYQPEIIAKLIPGIDIEPIVELNLLIGGGLKMAVFLYAAVQGIIEIFKLDGYKPIALSLGVFTIVLALWIHPNALETTNWNKSWADIFNTVPMQMILPVIIFLISLIKNKFKKQNKKQVG